jgi:hypothetical protein
MAKGFFGVVPDEMEVREKAHRYRENLPRRVAISASTESRVTVSCIGSALMPL